MARRLVPVIAQQIPTSPAEVARPGGTIPGVPKLALAKVADGFRDPVGVSIANDGSGRRTGRRHGSRISLSRMHVQFIG